MLVLGIHSGHDASLSLVRNGKLVAATAIERYSGKKKDRVITREYFDRFLAENNVKVEDIYSIAFGYWNKQFTPFISIYSPENVQYPLSVFGTYRQESSLMNHLPDYNSGRPEYVPGYGYTLPPYIDRMRPPYGNGILTHSPHFPLKVAIDGVPIVYEGYFVDHQTAHASSAFFTSPFNRAAIFTADSSTHTPTSCSGYMLGKGNRVYFFRNPGYMYGNFYDVATQFCGIGPGLTKAGVLMGLAAYGEVSQKVKDNWEDYTKPFYDRTEPEDHMYIDWLWSQLSGKFPYLDGPVDAVLNNDPDAYMYIRQYQQVYSKAESDSKEVMNIAADIQYMAEKSMVKYAQTLYEESKEFNDSNLCLAGGLFLNCNGNYKIATETDFSNVHLFPAAGDDGISSGAALYVAHSIYNSPRVEYKNKELMYLGKDYSNSKIEGGTELDLEKIASALAHSKIVCWYQGSAEFGPRALGHRSFLTDPRNPDMKDILNSRVKFREWYRPFAPIVLKEYAAEWFDLEFDSPFMLHTVPCKHPEKIPSVVHIDNSARVQTLEEEDNKLLYTLINKFNNITGVPILMNTSLNIKGRPIVETPEDALKLFNESDVDILIINNKMYTKS